MSSPAETTETLWTKCKTFVAQAIPESFRDDPYCNLIQSLASLLLIAIQNENINGVRTTFKRLMDHVKGRDDEWILALLERIARALSVKALETKPVLSFVPSNISVNVTTNGGGDNTKQQLYEMANTVGDFIYLARVSNLSDDAVVSETVTPGLP